MNNSYLKLPKPEINIPKMTIKISWESFIIGGFTSIVIVAIFLIVLMEIGVVDNCESETEQSITNASRIAYTQGIYDTSQYVLANGMLPVFSNQDGKIIIQYLNLSDNNG